MWAGLGEGKRRDKGDDFSRQIPWCHWVTELLRSAAERFMYYLIYGVLLQHIDLVSEGKGGGHGHYTWSIYHMTEMQP